MLLLWATGSGVRHSCWCCVNELLSTKPLQSLSWKGKVIFIISYYQQNNRIENWASALYCSFKYVPVLPLYFRKFKYCEHKLVRSRQTCHSLLIRNQEDITNKISTSITLRPGMHQNFNTILHCFLLTEVLLTEI